MGQRKANHEVAGQGSLVLVWLYAAYVLRPQWQIRKWTYVDF